MAMRMPQAAPLRCVTIFERSIMFEYPESRQSTSLAIEGAFSQLYPDPL